MNSIIISSEKVKNNIKIIKESIPGDYSIISVIKGDAYGHGIVAISRILDDIPEISLFAAASFEEAEILNENGIKKKILILNNTPIPYILDKLKKYPVEKTKAILKQLVFSIYSEEAFEQYDSLAKTLDVQINVHLRFDFHGGCKGLSKACFTSIINAEVNICHGTIKEGDNTTPQTQGGSLNLKTEGTCPGLPNEVNNPELPTKGNNPNLQIEVAYPNLNIEGVYSHVYSTYGEDSIKAEHDLREYAEVFNKIPPDKRKKWMVHMLTSLSYAEFPEYCFDAIRLGAALYGMPVVRDYKQSPLKPVMSVKGKIISICNIDEKAEFDYSGLIPPGIKKVAFASLGSWDAPNFFRGKTTTVNIRGLCYKSVGKPCMDSFCIDISGSADVQVDDDIWLLADLPGVTLFDKIEENGFEIDDCQILFSGMGRIKREIV